MREKVTRKLRSILNRLEGARQIGRHRDTLVHGLYAYGHETALVVTGLGLSYPVVNLLAQDPTQVPLEATATGVLESLSHYPTPILVMSAVLLVFWIVTRVTVNLRNLAKKVPLYHACRRELGKLESDLDAALSKPRPLDDLAAIQKNAKEIVDRYYQVDGWPWPFEPPHAEEAVDAEIERLCRKYEANWDALPDELQQREPVPAALGGGQ